MMQLVSDLLGWGTVAARGAGPSTTPPKPRRGVLLKRASGGVPPRSGSRGSWWADHRAGPGPYSAVCSAGDPLWQAFQRDVAPTPPGGDFPRDLLAEDLCPRLRSWALPRGGPLHRGISRFQSGRGHLRDGYQPFARPLRCSPPSLHGWVAPGCDRAVTHSRLIGGPGATRIG
jgi:hypothetical protein